MEKFGIDLHVTDARVCLDFSNVLDVMKLLHVLMVYYRTEFPQKRDVYLHSVTFDLFIYLYNIGLFITFLPGGGGRGEDYFSIVTMGWL